MRAIAQRYALAPACILLAVLLYFSPVAPLFPPAGLFVFSIIGVAWFGGAGPGVLTAVLGAIALPHIVPVSYPLVGGFLDLPRFIAFSIIGLAVGWGSTRHAGKLREQERYACAMSASDDGFWDWIVATDEMYASARLLEIYGFPPGTKFSGREDLIRRIPFHPEDSERMVRGIMEHFAGKTARFDIQMRFIRNGETRWVHLTGMTARDRSGVVVRWTGTVRDVTEHKHAEEALRESEDRFARAVAGSSDGVWDIDLVGRTVYFSPRTRELCGLPSGPEVVPLDGWFETLPLHPEDLPRRFAAVDAHLSGKAPAYDGEFRFLQPDGVYRWRRLHGLCVRDAEGKPLRMAGSMADVDARRRAEDALRESEQRVALAVAGSHDGIWSLDFVARSAFASPRARELAGLPPGPEVVPLDQWSAGLPIHPEDRQRRDAAIQAHLEGNVPTYEGEFRALQLDGVYRWRRVHGVCVRDTDGKPLHMAGTISDVDARRRAEDALRESEERYERAVDASDDGFWDWNPSEDKIYVSRRLREIYGIPSDATLASRADFMALIPFHAEDRPHLMRGFAEHLTGKGSRYKVEARILRNGETHWAQIAGLAARNASGALVQWTGTVRDITEIKRAEEALRESEQRHELAMAASESGYWDWDAITDRFVISARANELVGFPAEITFTNRADFRAHVPVHPEDWEKWETARKELFAGRGERLAMELRYIVRGETRWHALQAICKRDDTGKVVRWTGSSTDVTERKRAEEALRESERKLRQAQRLEAMGTLAGGIAHDFNNILGAILGYGEMALRGAAEGSRLRRDLDSILVAGERGRALIDRVLAFSRSSVGERVVVHVEKVVREALDLIEAQLPQGVRVEASLKAGGAAIVGESTQIHQVMMNLGTNAVQAMQAGGTLVVSLEVIHCDVARIATIGRLEPREYLSLTVADDGGGIPPEIIDRIFDPFFTTKEVGVGTGLGLSLVHGIVIDLGGAMDVSSRPGAGSTFTVFLPRVGDAVEATVPHAPALPGGNGECVLVVDDEELLVGLAIRTLEEIGYVPAGFTSSAAALAAFRADPARFDVIITDERMPGISGSTLIREVRGIRREMPILLMSGYLGGGLAERALDAGADDILTKPLSAHDLATGLARVLRK